VLPIQEKRQYLSGIVEGIHPIRQNQVPHGVGTLYFLKGSVYIGNFVEGVPFGKGRLIMSSGAYYEGQIRYGKANGEGEFRDGDYIYKGQFKDDMKHGEGI
jgi:hypothetical protein